MKRVLFVCVENSCRSQIAEGIAKELGKKVIEAYSAGSKPSGIINPMAIEVMREAGIDISNNASKGFDALAVNKFDYVITLGCQDTCPFFPADKHIEWKIDDPKGKDIHFFRKTRDSISDHVKRLIKDIGNSKPE
ncbi:MAG: arsenate reductase ArsC [Candidatus Omnitrophica bacterium]|jgi:arsenate reductase|nr:arsenate reductase ArsC [Candidatus Omnitrophota bacterium]MDD5661024.1 arsenate reductase ArsC [Candidatus Omnitrophota bacterium]